MSEQTSQRNPREAVEAAAMAFFENVDELADHYGVQCPEPTGRGGEYRVEPHQMRERIQRAGGTQAGRLRRCFETDADAERGAPGGRIVDGDIEATVPKYRPTLVRGHHGDDGLYEEYYRTEPQIHAAVNGITQVLTSATHEVQMPRRVQPEHEEELKRFVEWCNGWLHSLQHSQGGGLRSFVRHGASALIHGFAIHEPVWDVDSATGWHHPAYVGFREQSITDEWVMDDRQAELLAVDFSGAQIDDFTLTARGEQATDRKLWLSNINARGNNFEGISPIRPAIHWIKTKRVLAQIAAISAQKYGVPTTKVMEDVEWYKAELSPNYDGDDFDDLYDVYAKLQGKDGGVTKVPGGLKVGIEGPPGQMPSLLDLMGYCDQQIAHSFQNQGSLLGQDQVGSYALAEVQDNKWLRAAPAYHAEIFAPVESTIRWQARQYLEPKLGDTLAEYPSVGMRLDQVTDNSAWVDDITKLMGGKPLPQWPPKLRKIALEKMDVSPDALDVDEARPEAAGPPGDKQPPTPDIPRLGDE